MALPKARTIKTILRQGYDYRNRRHLRLCTLLLADVAGEWFFPSFTLIHGQDVWISEVRQQNPKGCKAGVRRRYAFANTCATIGWCGPSRTNQGAVRQQLPRRERKSRWILPSQGCLSVSGRSADGMAGMVGSWTSDMPDPITHSATVLSTLRPVRSNCNATETALGFLLPPVLSALYTEVANDGFGPGGGIQGTLGGYGSRSDEPARTIVDDYHWHCQVGYTEVGHHGPVRLVDLSNVAGQGKRGSGKEDLLLPHEVWPQGLLSLEDLGCCMRACLDCKTGGVLCVAPSGNDEEYEIGPIASSLEEYLERWLREEVVP